MDTNGISTENEFALNRVFNLASADQIKAILDTLPSSAVIVNADGRFLFVNRRGLELYGTDYSGFQVKALRPYGSSFPLEEMPVRHLLQSGLAMRNVEMIVENVDGTRYPVNVNSAPLRDKDGDTIGSIVIFDDCSAHKKAEADLLSANRHLDEVIESISDAFYSVDSSWRLTYVSRKAEEWWHRSSEDLLGTVLWKMFPAPEKTVRWKMHHEAMETRRPVHWKTFSPSLKTWVEASAYPSADGGITVLFRNIAERKKAEETFFFPANIIQSVHDAIIAMNEDFGIIYWNDMAEKMFGWTAEEAIGKFPKDLLQTEIPGSSREAVVARLFKDNYFVGEVIYRHKDGSKIYTDVHSTVMRGSDGKVTGVITSFRDITTQKEAEEKLKKSEECFRAVQENSLDRFAILKPFHNDQSEIIDFTYVYQNTQAAKPAGCSPEALAGRRMTEVFPGFTKTRSFDHYKQVVETGQALEFEDRYHSNGVDDWFRATVTPLPDGVAIAMRTITESKKAEEILLFQASILQSVHDAIVAMNQDFCIIYWNDIAEKMFGFTAEEAIGKFVIDLLHTEVPGSSREAAIARLFENNYFEGKVIYHHKDGSKIYTDVHSTVTRGSDGKATGIIASLRDITTQKEAEERLKKSEQKALALICELEEAARNKNQFLGVLSHELRNPLAAIVAGLSLLDITDDAEQVSKAKEIMRRQTNQLCKLVDDLLELTRITQNKIVLSRENINLNEIIKNATSDIKRVFDRKSLQLNMNLPEKPVFVHADPVRITQCISNYLSNAFKFTPENGTIWISLETEKGNAVINVQDNGIGISPDVRKQLFKPFIQADHSLARNRDGGLGLGLSIVKAIVELHGGTVAAASPGLGKGAKFTMTLPILEGSKGTPERLDTKNCPKAVKVLMIEDNRDLSDILCSFLNILGHEVSAAYTGIDGVREARASRPDIIFCDIGLPGKNGYEVAKIIREDDTLSRIFLVALTGYAGEKDMELAEESGFDRYLAKPVNTAKLQQVLEEYSRQNTSRNG